MNPDLTALKTYINTQRQNGISDEAISQALISSGWQPDVVAGVLADQGNVNDAPSQVQSAPVTADDTAATIASPENNETDQTAVEQSPVVDKNRKKVKVIGIIMIVLGVLGVAVNAYPDVNTFLLVLGVIQILIGVGILRFNKIAYTLFNIVAILSILTGLVLLLGIPLMLLALATSLNIFTILMTLVYLLVSVGQLAFYVYGGIVFHNKAVRSLFDKKQAQV